MHTDYANTTLELSSYAQWFCRGVLVCQLQKNKPIKLQKVRSLP